MKLSVGRLLGGLLRLLGQQNIMDVGQNTTLSDRDARQQLVHFLVVIRFVVDFMGLGVT